MSTWTTMVEANKVRLRASCNACNESKVRCSQGKPTCTRCERNEIECIYGLSRRTHKDAPPISIPSSQRGRRHVRLGKGSRHTSSVNPSLTSSSNSNSPHTTGSVSNGCTIPDEPIDTHNGNSTSLHEYLFPTVGETDTMQGGAQMLDFNSLVPDSTTNPTVAPSYFSTSRNDFTTHTGRELDSVFDPGHNGNAMQMGDYQPHDGENDCRCHSGVTESLKSMRDRGSRKVNMANSHDQTRSTDAQLARLKQCIIASETSMRCTHGRDDSEPMHIMAIAMLIGYAMDDFAILANESGMSRSASLSSSSSSVSSTISTSSSAAAGMTMLNNTEIAPRSGMASPTTNNISLSNLIEPRLSWGVLELEEEDELDLRHRLYLLSFRKLERLLSQFTMYIQNLHCALVSLPDPSRHMPFVIMCDYTRLWLEKKASDVKRSFMVSARDDPMNSIFA